MKIKEDKIYNFKKNLIKIINYIAIIACMFSVCAFDADSLIPIIIFLISMVYLIIVASINGYFDDLLM